MTVVTNSRATLDNTLADPRATLLLLSGNRTDKAGAVHDLAVRAIQDPWRYTFLITDLSVLTPTERTQWVNSAGRYAVLGGANKQVAKKGSVEDLCRQDGEPSILRIRGAFAAGDQL